ncbi:hypothetical protein Tco_0285255 [Tanacetum coccineum]
MDQDSAHIVAASKVPMLKLGEFALWRMRIEQYILMTDYALWEVIKNGATLPKTQVVEGVTTVMPITSAEDKVSSKEGPNYALYGLLHHQVLTQRKNDDALIIEEWVSDSEEENVSQPKTKKKIVKPSIAKIEFVKPKQQEKTARKTVKQAEKHRQNTHSPRGNQRNWNNMMSQRLGSNFEMFNKACYVCGSFDHLQGNPQIDLQDQGVMISGVAQAHNREQCPNLTTMKR